MNIGSETETVEFKKSTSELNEGMISLSAMLNKHGKGVLYFGVKNNGDAVGQQIGDATLRDVSRAVAVSIQPQVIPTVSVELMGNKNVIRVSVKGDEKPYSAEGRYYIRTADEDRAVTPGQLRDMMLATVDSITRMEADNQNLTFEQLFALYAGKRKPLNENMFRQNLNLMTKQGTYNLLAELLSDMNSYSLKVAVFAGTDKTRLLSRNEYGFGCLLLGMKNAADHVRNLNETFVNMEGFQRRNRELFDFAAFREAWVNACLHTRWTRKTPPAVNVYQDRIEVVSAGGLPEGLRREQFFSGMSKPVNLQLQQIMLQLDFIEQTGHGVPLIVSRYGRKAFLIEDNFITVTIPFAETTDVVQENAMVYHTETGSYGNTEENLSANERKILGMLKENREYTTAQLSLKSGLSTVTVSRIFQSLKKKGKLSRIGSRKSGYWKADG